MDFPISRILTMTGLAESELAAVYPYGSRVYGTHSEASDHDFLVVHYGDPAKDAQQYDSQDGMLSVHAYHVDSWIGHVDNHKIFALESIFLPQELKLPGSSKFSFKLDKPLLRTEISAKASNSWVKCKKKLTVEVDQYHIGIKSLFHAFRIPMFGIQIAQHGRLTDYAAANELWFNEFEPMLHTETTWDQIKEIYQPRHNALMTEFRTYAEKV